MASAGQEILLKAACQSEPAHTSPPHPPPDNLQNAWWLPASPANYSRRCQARAANLPATAAGDKAFRRRSRKTLKPAPVLASAGSH